MARPPKLTVDYFPHLVHWGKTIPILESKFGNDGYAVWFKLLEQLGNTPGHFLDLSDPIDREFLQQKCRVDEFLLTEIIELLVRLGAIDADLWRDSQIIWSQNFVDGLQELYSRRRISPPEMPTPRGLCTQKPERAEISKDNNRQRRGEESKGKERRGEKDKSAASPPSADADPPPLADPPDPPFDVDQTRQSEYREFERVVVEAWNTLPCPPFVAVSKLTDDRRKHLRARFGEKAFRDNIAAIVERIRGSTFLRGGNDRAWIASFDWLIKNEQNYTKTLEGKYDDRKNHTNGTARSAGRRDFVPTPDTDAELRSALALPPRI